MGSISECTAFSVPSIFFHPGEHYTLAINVNSTLTFVQKTDLEIVPGGILILDDDSDPFEILETGEPRVIMDNESMTVNSPGGYLYITFLAPNPCKRGVIFEGNLSLTKSEYKELGYVPTLRGWGGVRLCEVDNYYDDNLDERKQPESHVFPGEVASDAELTMQLLVDHGYNTIRAYFEPPNHSGRGDEDWERRWLWNDTWFRKFVTLAKFYDLWMIVDYHGYYEPYEWEDDWIEFWSELISTYGSEYTKFVWQPCNEPVMQNRDGSHELHGQDAVDALQRLYQRWINMCRQLGDTHWLIVSATAWGNSLLDPVDWFPTVNDPLNRTFLDYHFYYFYEWESDWTVDAAREKADWWTSVIQRVSLKHHKPFLTTELGAFYGIWSTPPDAVGDYAAAYSNISLAFVDRLISNLNEENLGWILLPAGDWSSPNTIFGAMLSWGADFRPRK